jgi:WD40 repeat protein
VTVGTPSSPYKGLNAFEDSELDALLFFGREREREIVAANIAASRLTVLYGPSGVGKSSLLSAAVARSLRQLPETPLVIVFSRWSDDPATALAEAVTRAQGAESNGSALTTLIDAQSDRDVYLILDQTEEYFLYHADDAGPDSFAETLPAVLAGRYRINVLVSLREDALANLDRFTGRIDGLFANTLRLDRLDRDAARTAIVRPVERFAELTQQSVGVEPGLVELVLEEVGTGRIEPAIGGRGSVEGGAVGARVEAPYLQLVMQRLWEEERAAGSDVLRAETLRRLGGSRRIVEEHLDGAIAELTIADKDVAARLFNHLVTPSGTKIAHTAADLADFGHVRPHDLQPVLDRLTERRILRSLDEAGGRRYEIFHDVLAQPVLAWRARHRTEREVEQKLADAHRRRRTLQRLFALVLVALGLMSAIAVFALSQRTQARSDRADARRAAEVANRASREARVSGLEAQARAAADPRQAVQFARRAAGLAPPSAETEDILRDALQAFDLRSVARVGGYVLAAQLRNGKLLSATADGSLVTTNLSTGHSRSVRKVSRTRAASFANDGTGLLIGEDGAARLVRPGRQVSRIRGLSGLEGGVLTLDGKLAVLFNPGGTYVVDLESGDVVQRFPSRRTRAVAISRDGDRVATARGNRIIRIWDVRSGRLVQTVFGQFGGIRAVALGTHGERVAGADKSGIAEVWTVADGKSIATLTGHSNALTDIDFSSDAREVVTASRDKTIKVWLVGVSHDRATLRGHQERVTSAKYVPGDSMVVSTSADGTTRLWSIAPAELKRLADIGSPVTSVEYDRGAGHVLAAGKDGRLHVLDASTGAESRSRAAPKKAQVASCSGATAKLRRNVVLLTFRGRTTPLRGHTAKVTSAVFSHDCRLLVTASLDSDARIWDVATRTLVRTLAGHTGPVRDAEFSPDGRWVVTAGTKAGIWNARTSKRLMFVQSDGEPLTAATFDPTGRTILTGSRDGTVRTYRCELCGNLDDLLALAKKRLAATTQR